MLYHERGIICLKISIFFIGSQTLPIKEMNVHFFVLMILERILEMTAKFNVFFFSVACMKISDAHSLNQVKSAEDSMKSWSAHFL